MGSPFKMKSPLNVYKPSAQGAYANPRFIEDLRQTPNLDELGEGLSSLSESVFNKSMAPPSKEKSDNETTMFEADPDDGPEHDNLPNNPYTNPFTAKRQDGTNPVVTGDGTTNNKKPSGNNNNSSTPTYRPLSQISDEGDWQSGINMNGSIANTASAGQVIDPYANINPQAVPGIQQQEQIEGSKIPLQPRKIDQDAMSDPYSSPGATINPKQAINAESIFGQKTQRQALMNLGKPFKKRT
jgi:hypothetical protein